MICGVDEAGRGPVIGPLIVAGITLKDDTELVKLKVRDSKQVSPRKRTIFSKKILEISLNYEIIVIPAKDIDDMRNVMTLNEIEVNAFSKIIKKLNPETCYVDSADVNANRFATNILSQLTSKPLIISKHKADEIYPIVSAASIIAKTRRDEEVRKISEKLEKKLNLPLGSGYPADPITQKFLINWINKYDELPPYTRRSWKTVKNIFNEKKNKKLDDFNIL